MIMNFASKLIRRRSGFTLAEVMAAVIIGSMVLVAVLTVYTHARGTAATISRNLDKGRLAREVLQRIAEDLDRIISSGPDTKVFVENKVIGIYPAARLRIYKTIKKKGRDEEFETIVWQSSYDYESDANGLVLYRKHSGIALEDKLLDELRADWEKAYPFVQVCSGVTYFDIKVPQGKDKFVKNWPGKTMPTGIVVAISFAEPYETLEGTLEVPEQEKFTRTIAINRTRKIGFVFIPDSAEALGAPEDEKAPEDDEALEGDEAAEETDALQEDAGDEQEKPDSVSDTGSKAKVKTAPR